MTRIYPSNVAADGSTMPKWHSLDAYEDAIAAIPSLHGWYSAWSADHRTDVGGKCSQLTDRSGGGRHLLQATDANRPTISADYFGDIGGTDRDALAFSGAADLYMETAANFYDGSSHTWSYAAVAVSQGTGQQAILSNAGGSEQLMQQSDTNIRFFSPAHALTIPTNTGQVMKIIGVRDDPVATNITYSLECNGVSNTGSLARANVVAGKLRLGMAGAGSKRWNGVIAELIVKKGVFSTDEKALIRAYFAFLYSAAGTRV